MNSLKNGKGAILGALALIGLMGASGTAVAQDFPGFKANGARTGRNDTPVAAGSGTTRLVWFAPFGVSNTGRIVLDNTDHPDAWNLADAGAGTNTYIGGPYDFLLDATNQAQSLQYGVVTSFPLFRPQEAAYNADDNWVPVNNQDAGGNFAYTVGRRNKNRAGFIQDSSLREPRFAYTRATPSALGSDPTVAINNAERRFYEYRFGGVANVPRYYGISAWLPVGPVPIAPSVLNPNGLIYPQQFFVYEITDSNGQRFVDVVDTYAAGGGWARLGGGGRPTNAVFYYDGVTPIRVRLYNTVPRGSDGQLLINPDPGSLIQRTSERWAVFADAMLAATGSGYYNASPTVANQGVTAGTRAIGARNEISTQVVDGELSVRASGVVTSYNHNFGDAVLNNNIRWNFSPQSFANPEVAVDNSNATNVTVGASWLPVLDPDFQNGEAVSSPITNVVASEDRVTYGDPALTMPDGDYDIFVYLPGNQGVETYGASVRYYIQENGAESNLTLNQQANRGWVRLGSRSYRHSATQPLEVAVSNYSANPADAGLRSMADAVRFVYAGSIAINSTPVQANINLRDDTNTIVSRDVVFVADESGRIWCLDANGNGTGGTTVYWCYPSLRRAGFVDPNLTSGIDGPNAPAPTDESIPTAEMPTGFDLSSATVQRIGAKDYLFIGSRNGRVYCIDAEGRGDYVSASNTPGTAERVWTFPNDFPANNVRSDLGQIAGSVIYGDTPSGPTVFVPTSSGRIVALEALPGTANRTTNIRWAWPPANTPGTGAITSTPTLEFGNLYFGVQAAGAEYPRLFSIDANTGTQNWAFPTDAQVGTAARYNTKNWLGSAISVPAALSGIGDTIYAVNQNGWVYALDAATGTERWGTNELNVGSTGSLTFTVMSLYDNFGALIPNIPAVVVPTENGALTALFANNTINRFGTKRAWQYQLAGDTLTASAAAGQNFLYAADSAGVLYGFSDYAGVPITPGEVPGQETIVENNPAGDIFRGARLGFINGPAFRALSLPQSDPAHLEFNELIDPGTLAIRPIYSTTRVPQAFEWGEAVYLVAYNFPYVRESQTTPGQLVPPPVVNFTFAVEGATARSVPVESRQFSNPAAAPLNATEPSLTNDGYAILNYIFQGGGPSALPPGQAEAFIAISTQSLNPQQALQQVALDPTLTRASFTLANPIAISMLSNWAVPTSAPAALGSGLEIGLSPNPSALPNLVNGAPDIGGTAAREDRLLTTAGFANHGQRSTARAYIYDRSMMGLIRPDGLGLDNVRVGIGGLQWQGVTGTLVKPLDPTLYPGFEDYPGFPNISVDYPDIRREAISTVVGRNANAQNPTFVGNGITLPAARINDGGTLRELRDGDDPLNRVFVPSTLDFDIDVPKYQPANNAQLGYVGALLSAPAGANWDSRFLLPNSLGNTNLPQGYLGRVNVFVDSTQNGVLDATVREAFRSLNVATTVVADERLSVVTPTVDPSSNQGLVQLGSLAGGTGYELVPGGFSPWTVKYQNIFQPFTVLNDGNVNLLDVRLAKSVNNGGITPWALGSSTNDGLAWLDGTLDLWSNFDTTFAPSYGGLSTVNRQILPKARVGDTVPTQLRVNPTPRANPNIAGSFGPLTGAVPANSQPAVGVSIPLGFPSGTYSSQMRVIENGSWFNPALSNDVLDRTGNTFEAFGDPTFNLTFNVRESRLTTRNTKNTAPQVDDESLLPATDSQSFRNVQPAAMRDVTGALLMAWASNRPDVDVSRSATPPISENWRIYFASVDNATNYADNDVDPQANAGVSPLRDLTLGNKGFSPLRDLSFFTPGAANTWFKKPVALANGYPTAAQITPALFGATTIQPGTARFYSPSFPAMGRMNPTAPTAVSQAFSQVLMSFVGEANTDTGPVSRLFIAAVELDANGNVTNVTDPLPLPGDSVAGKGKPTIVQTANDAAIVFFPGRTGNSSAIYYARYANGAWQNFLPVPVGSGFDSVQSVAAGFRQGAGGGVLEVAFSARLRGAQSFGIYRGTVPLDGTTALPETAAGVLNNPFWNSGRQVTERLTSVGAGRYRVAGIAWDPRQPIALAMTINGAPVANPVDLTTRVVDAASGVISYETALGGRVVLDPADGSVRFVGSVPPRNADLSLTYSPRFYRVSEGSAGYSEPQVMFESKAIGDASYWVPADATNTAVRNDRMIMVYSRQGGEGQASRPVMKTMRFGIQLPTPILTNNAGAVASLTVSGNSGPYQVDPANGRVYFTAVDENANVQINYVGAEPASGNALPAQNIAGVVGLIEETKESAIRIEQAVNEINATAFLDPFDPNTTDVRFRRPTLIWLFWTSSRAGSNDIYMQTIAPRFAPQPLGR